MDHHFAIINLFQPTTVRQPASSDSGNKMDREIRKHYSFKKEKKIERRGRIKRNWVRCPQSKVLYSSWLRFSFFNPLVIWLITGIVLLIQLFSILRKYLSFLKISLLRMQRDNVIPKSKLFFNQNDYSSGYLSF